MLEFNIRGFDPIISLNTILKIFLLGAVCLSIQETVEVLSTLR